MRCVAGIDAGGTRTRCQVADETGHILSAGYGGPANKNFVSSLLAQRAVERALSEALKLINKPVDSAVVAGPHLPAEAVSYVSGRVGKIIVTDEFVASLAAGLQKTDGWGAVILSGTGSFCRGRNSEGREKYIGGWGPLIGDEGSGYDLAGEALKALVRACDGRGRPTLLTELIFSHFGIRDAQELKNALYTPIIKRHRFAELAKYVFFAAAKGDAVARGILRNGGKKLAKVASPVLQELFKKTEHFPVVLSGGILCETSALSDALIAEIKRGWPRANVFIPELQPVTGAVIIALDSIGVRINEQVTSNLIQSNRRLGK